MNGPVKTTSGEAYARQALLPEGFRDQLAPHAEQEATLVRGLMDTFLSHGYDRVSPPVVEYEDSLLIGAGATRGHQMFRVMDSETQRMMAVRSDMTVQLSRLASTRLADAARPLRLAYTGSVLRTKGSQIRPARQFIQAGVELVGCATVEAEVEVIAVAVEALQAVGIDNLTVDLTLAPLSSFVCDTLGVEGSLRNMVLEALDAKDVGALAQLAEKPRRLFEQLLASTGDAGEAIATLEGLSFSDEAAELVSRLAELVKKVQQRLPGVELTIDPCETHGFEYKSGIGFALFAKGGQSELGRGGRYLVQHPDGHTEEATGFSVYLDSLMAALPVASGVDKVFLPFGTDPGAANKLRKQGLRTIQGLTEVPESRQEAARLGCTHIYSDGAVEAL
jgi:ATP phosphoribosyltransferase regulatory subunit